MSMEGAFIVLEGIDGVGKTTISKRLGAWLEGRGRKAVLTAEPTEGWLGMAVRRANREDLDPRTEALLFTADRCQHTLAIERLLAEGNVVVSDRYYGSTVAYQGASLERGMGEGAVEWLLAMNRPVVRRPDLTVLLTCDPGAAMRRVGARGDRSKFEREGYLGRVQEIYLMLAGDLGWTVVSSDGPLDAVFERVRRAVQAYV